MHFICELASLLIHQYEKIFKWIGTTHRLGKIYVIFLESSSEISVDDGATGIFSYGNILLAEDIPTTIIVLKH